MSETFLYEFLYRGRGPGAAEPPGWHVVLAQSVAPPGGGAAQTVLSGALTPAQAEAAGFGLPALLSAINAGVMAERDAKAAALAVAEAERESLRRQLATVTAERDALRALAPASSETPAA
ncbi:hypothetical protein [Methylobacterium sp. JK268]